LVLSGIARTPHHAGNAQPWWAHLSAGRAPVLARVRSAANSQPRCGQVTLENLSVAWIWAACAVVYPVFIIGIGAYRDWARAKVPTRRVELDAHLRTATGGARISRKPLPEGHRAVATNFAATRALRRLTGSDTVSEQDSNGNLATKFLRIFAAQSRSITQCSPMGSSTIDTRLSIGAKLEKDLSAAI